MAVTCPKTERKSQGEMGDEHWRNADSRAFADRTTLLYITMSKGTHGSGRRFCGPDRRHSSPAFYKREDFQIYTIDDLSMQ